MKKFITTALVCLSVVAVAAAPSLAGRQLREEVNGDISSKTPPMASGRPGACALGVQRQEGSPAKGNVSYSDRSAPTTRRSSSVTLTQMQQDATISATMTVHNHRLRLVGTRSRDGHDLATSASRASGSTTHGHASTVYRSSVITAGNIQVLA